jgi:redox-sensitive bicupin YhaK (pirin superfamily)
MKTVRKIKAIRPGVLTLEGAGVRLRRAFGFEKVPGLDPFLLLDDFSSSDPDDYIAGFPWHPHRGIETITYLLKGEIAHGDSLGNQGLIGPGDVQWMTAGSGIIHQEMPRENRATGLQGFQLWANLPAAEKMTAPRYRDVQSRQIPVSEGKEGVKARVVCGTVDGVQGPVREIRIDPEYLDIEIPAGAIFRRPFPAGYTVFAYVFAGSGYFDLRSRRQRGDRRRKDGGAFPPRFRQAAARTGGLARPNRHEHRGGAADSLRRIRCRHVPQAPVRVRPASLPNSRPWKVPGKSG